RAARHDRVSGKDATQMPYDRLLVDEPVARAPALRRGRLAVPALVLDPCALGPARSALGRDRLCFGGATERLDEETRVRDARYLRRRVATERRGVDVDVHEPRRRSRECVVPRRVLVEL